MGRGLAVLLVVLVGVVVLAVTRPPGSVDSGPGEGVHPPPQESRGNGRDRDTTS